MPIIGLDSSYSHNFYKLAMLVPSWVDRGDIYSTDRVHRGKLQEDRGPFKKYLYQLDLQ